MTAQKRKSWARAAALFALLLLAALIALEQNLSQTMLDMAFAEAYSMAVETLNKAVKLVTENGVEVSREPVNSSKYKMSPRSAIVGVATDDPQKQIEIMAAIGTYNIDHVKNVIALLTAPPAE